MDFEVVERPALPRAYSPRGKYERITAAIKETVQSGQAVRILLNGVRLRTLRNSLRRVINQHGLSFRSISDAEALTCWAEEMSDVYLQRGMASTERPAPAR